MEVVFLTANHNQKNGCFKTVNAKKADFKWGRGAKFWRLLK
jgi:hypothetical protein